MEVRPGYKLTEVGVIPLDWATDTMLRISRQIMDYRGRTPKKLGMDWGGGDIPALSAGNVKMGFVDFREECYLGSETLYSRWMTRGDVVRDDILFTTEAPLGNVALVPDDRKYILSQRTILLQLDQEQVSSRFIFQLMLSDGFQRILADYSSGSTAKGIQRKKFEQLCIALPPLPEQHAIATALSDVDALLGGLDRLIAKKRDLKQAAMQQLLTGQTRLPGFHGEWEVKTLGDIVERIEGGGTPSRANPAFWGNEIPWITVKDFATFDPRQSQECITRLGLRNSASHLIPTGTLITSTRMALGKAVVYEVDVAINQDLKALFLKLDTSVLFLTYWFEYFGGMIDELGSGSTVKGISLIELRRFAFQAPPLPEQTAIATVLSDMDAELSALGASRDKTRALKQAMMKELLTGRTRLVPAGAAHA